MDVLTLSCALYEAFRLGAILQNLRNSGVSFLEDLRVMVPELESLLKQVAEGDIIAFDTHNRDQVNISSVQADFKEQAFKLMRALNYRIE